MNKGVEHEGARDERAEHEGAREERFEHEGARNKGAIAFLVFFTILPVTRLVTATWTVALVDSVSVSTVPFVEANDDELSRSEEIRSAGGGGSEVMTADVAEIATAEPASLVAVTTTRSTWPPSAWLSRCVVPVAPPMS